MNSNYEKSKETNIKTDYNQTVKDDRERGILKTAKEKWLVMSKEDIIRLWSDFSAEILLARWEWDNIFNMMKEKTCQPRILYLTNLSFKN